VRHSNNLNGTQNDIWTGSRSNGRLKYPYEFHRKIQRQKRRKDTRRDPRPLVVSITHDGGGDGQLAHLVAYSLILFISLTIYFDCVDEVKLVEEVQ
jgi:hypothetical protein